MSIINSANPGSSISALENIFNIVSRNNGALTEKELLDLCRPEFLTESKNAYVKAAQTFEFWQSKVVNPLWEVRGKAKSDVETVHLTNFAEKNYISQDRLGFAHCINEILTCGLEANLFEKSDGGRDVKALANPTAHALIMIGAALVHPTYAPGGTKSFGPEEIKVLATHIDGVEPPNDAEHRLVMEWGYFLGYLEFDRQLDSSGGQKYQVDPTRALKRIQSRIFHKKKRLSIREYLALVGQHCSLLDGGVLRLSIEKRMSSALDKIERQLISRSLGHSLLRLYDSNTIQFISLSDDKNSVQIDGYEGRISEVEFVGADV